MKLITLTNVSELNPLLPNPPQTNNKETNNYGIKPPLYVKLSILNITMLPQPEDTNSNSLLN